MEIGARRAAQLEQLLRLQRALTRAHAEMQRHHLQRDAFDVHERLEHDAAAIAAQRDIVSVLLEDRPACEQRIAELLAAAIERRGICTVHAESEGPLLEQRLARRRGAFTNSCSATQSACSWRTTSNVRSATTLPSVPLWPCTLYVATRSSLIVLARSLLNIGTVGAALSTRTDQYSGVIPWLALAALWPLGAGAQLVAATGGCARREGRRGAVPESVRVLDEVVERLTEAPLYRDNAVELLLDGPQTHDAMLEAIASAEHHVHLESYIFADDEVGTEFAEALAAKARMGVTVRVIYDSIGSRGVDGDFWPASRTPASSCVSSTRRIPSQDQNPFDIDTATIASCSSSTAEWRSPAASTSTATTRGRRTSSAARARRRDGATRTSASTALPSPRFRTYSWVFGNSSTRRSKSRRMRRRRAGSTKATRLVRVLSAVGGNDEVSQIWVAYQAAAKVARDRIWITQSYFAPDDEFMAAITKRLPAASTSAYSSPDSRTRSCC